MKQFKYFTSQDWSNYIGPYLYRKLKKRYGTNKAIVSSAYTMEDDQNSEMYASYVTNDHLGFKLIDTVFNVYKNDENMQKKDRLAMHTWKCEKQCHFCLVCWSNKMDDLMLVKEQLK